MARIWITMGDPAGIGPEIISRALGEESWSSDYEFTVVGNSADGVPGRPDAKSAKSAYRSLEIAAEALVSGVADAVVTGPVSKEQLQSVGFLYPGQTEFFANVFGIQEYGMLLTGPTLTVGLATIHVAISEVSKLLVEEGILTQGRLVADFLRLRGIDVPKIAVAGLNPHAGENGAFGEEEIRVIAPAIARMQEMGNGQFSGPHVPDAIFRDAAMGKYDAVLAMYHDQGLIPLKLLDFDSAVNVTLGLPRPRVSPDHGTAFGIAGKGIAKPDSMIAAIRLSYDLVIGRTKSAGN